MRRRGFICLKMIFITAIRKQIAIDVSERFRPPPYQDCLHDGKMFNDENIFHLCTYADAIDPN